MWNSPAALRSTDCQPFGLLDSLFLYLHCFYCFLHWDIYFERFQLSSSKIRSKIFYLPSWGSWLLRACCLWWVSPTLFSFSCWVRLYFSVRPLPAYGLTLGKTSTPSSMLSLFVCRPEEEGALGESGSWMIVEQSPTAEHITLRHEQEMNFCYVETLIL